MMNYMTYIVDIVLALVLVFSVIKGYKKGFIKTAFNLLTVVLAIAAAYFFGPSMGEVIRTTDAYNSVCESVNGTITDYFMNRADGEAVDEATVAEDVPVLGILDRLGVDTEELYMSYENAMAESSQNAAENVMNNVAAPVLEALSTALGAVVVFIVAWIVLKIVKWILESIFKLPVLKGLNKLAGLAAGAVLGVLSCFVICLVIEVLLPYIPSNPILYPGMENSTVLYNFFVTKSPFFFLLFG